MKYKLPDHLKQLVKDVPSYCSHLFGDDVQKGINQIAATNTAATAAVKGNLAESNVYQIRSSRNTTKNYYAHQRSSAQGKSGSYKLSIYRGKRN